jgi:hypothetical protein
MLSYAFIGKITSVFSEEDNIFTAPYKLDKIITFWFGTFKRIA